jgi:hypothetical protein
VKTAASQRLLVRRRSCSHFGMPAAHRQLPASIHATTAPSGSTSFERTIRSFVELRHLGGNRTSVTVEACAYEDLINLYLPRRCLMLFEPSTTLTIYNS